MGTALTDYRVQNVIQNIMSQRPKRTKPDLNQNEIVTDLRKLGFDVYDTHDLDEDDIVVFGKKIVRDGIHDWIAIPVYCGVGVEIKSENGKLSDTQRERIRNGNGARIEARCTEDILAWFGK